MNQSQVSGCPGLLVKSYKAEQIIDYKLHGAMAMLQLRIQFLPTIVLLISCNLNRIQDKTNRL